MTVVPYLVIAGRWLGPAPPGRRPGIADLRGAGLELADRRLLRGSRGRAGLVLEMSEKTGLSQILVHRRHPLLAGQWPGMVLPWSLIALAAVILPFLLTRCERAAGTALRQRDARSGIGVPWFALVVGRGQPGGFLFWTVAKPNYYVPCLPGMALLIGSTWVHLRERAAAEAACAWRPA